MEGLIGVLLVGLIVWAVLHFTPGLRVEASKVVDSFTIDDTQIDNRNDADFIELPSKKALPINAKTVRIAGYAWNGQTAIISANGGPITTKGSLMEKQGLHVQILKQDWLSELRNMQLKFVEEFHKGNQFPESDKAAQFVIIMGDGAPFYISSVQPYLNKTYPDMGYKLQVVGAIGKSRGEDKLIGPVEWKTNPQAMLGSMISVVVGDGDWVVLINYAALNNLKVNPDFTTYDPDAINIHPSQDDDYINSAKELIQSQTNNFKVSRKVVKNGKLTGENIDVLITGAATWTPGDKIVFDALKGYTDIVSTAEFINQMPTTIITLNKFAEKNPNIVTGILTASYQAADQIKNYDEWARRGSEAVAETFQLENADYWYTMFKGQTLTKEGVTYNLGGSSVMNYADALQYYGITDGNNRYKSVWEQVTNYLTVLNPNNLMEDLKQITPYDEAVNLTYLKSVHDVKSKIIDKVDYSTQRTEVVAKGEWNINFATNSAEILPSSLADLESITNLLNQAEDTRLTVIGHTDSSGNPAINEPLSRSRAESVVAYLKKKGIPSARFQFVDGKGDAEPLGENMTAQGRAKNRRVTITVVK
jgi:outer membrane protein OmpA-like peptidoglycan-associated protein